MRIIAGSAGGIRINAAAAARPYLEKTRGAIFNSLLAHLADSAVLDLYAGSGANGIEALSRGAARAVLVETDRAAVKIIEANLRACNLRERGEIRPQNAADFLRYNTETFDLIFIDPPFTDAAAEKAAYPELIAGAAKFLNPDGRLIFRREIYRAAPLEVAGLTVKRDKTYGRSQVLIYAPAPNAVAAQI